MCTHASWGVTRCTHTTLLLCCHRSNKTSGSPRYKETWFGRLGMGDVLMRYTKRIARKKQEQQEQEQQEQEQEQKREQEEQEQKSPGLKRGITTVSATVTEAKTEPARGLGT